MSNFKWMWPPRNCGPCICTKKTWRSTKSTSTGEWSAPVLVATQEEIPCAEGQNWTLIAPCVAEFIRYERCDSATGTPPTPAIPTPDCIVTPPPPCEPCFEETPASASFTLPGPWGNYIPVRLGPPLNDIFNVSGEPQETCPQSGAPVPLDTCSFCEDIPSILFILDAAKLCDFYHISCPFPFDFCGTCGTANNLLIGVCGFGGWLACGMWNTTYQCCVNKLPSEGGGYAIRTYDVVICVTLGVIEKNPDGPGCRMGLHLTVDYTQRQIGGTPSTAVRWFRSTARYQSDILTAINGTTKTFALASTVAPRCDNQWPATLDVTFSA
jgi:hypothetical protein